jgi:predicted metal-dependent peptidase
MADFSKAEARLSEARTYLGYARWYYTTAIHSLHVVMTTEVPAFAVDEHWRLYVNPGWVERYPVQQTATALAHEIQHLLLDHAGRAATVGVTSATLQAWNEGADCDIDDGLLADCLNCRPVLPPLPEEWCTLPKHFGLPDGRVAEWYFAQRIAAATDSKSGAGETKENGGAGNGGRGRSGAGSGRGVGLTDGKHGCGSGASGVAAPWDVGSPTESGVDGLDAADAWDVRRRVAEDIKAYHEAARGQVPEGLLAWSEELLRPETISWNTLLWNAVRRARQTAAGTVRRSYARPSRRQDAFGSVIMPAFRRPRPVIAFVCDTSLSMEQDRALVRGVVDDACRQLATPVRVIDVDSAVHRDVMVRDGRKAAQAGSGGTDMRVGIEHALKKPRPADCIVVCSDCDTDWPATRPPAHMIVVAVRAKKEHLTAIPPWATVIEVT